MSTGDEWSPDEPLGTETFEQGDEAFDDEDQLTPGFTDAVEGDPSIDPVNELDELELGEAGAVFGDPEAMVTLQGGGDDPDGMGGPLNPGVRSSDEHGWDLDGSDPPDDEKTAGS